MSLTAERQENRLIIATMAIVYVGNWLWLLFISEIA